MRMFRFHSVMLALGLLAAAGAVTVVAPAAYAQNATTGAISGAVMDSSGAVVPNATVTVANAGTGATITVVSNAEGRYTAANLQPGQYKVSASATGMQSGTSQINVLVGTTVPADIKVTPSGSKEVVEVTSTTLPLVDTENVALATNFNSQQIQELPTPGGDVTTVAFTAPGVVVNEGGGYGNFSSNGLPGVSNLFVLNGFDNEDPFLNLNNSGSSNLTLGQGELAEATVVQNGYDSQYGRAAGAIIDYTTKSGTNKFHGMVDYNWNGSMMNANGWFNQNTEASAGVPLSRPHAVSNEWAANVGGPIVRDKVFFFADYEGLRYVLPGSSGPITFPTANLDNYIMANVPTVAQSLYGMALADFKKSPAYSVAKPVTGGSLSTQDGNNLGGCGDPAAGGMAGVKAPDGSTFGPSSPCMLVGTASVNNINKEWLFTGRGDWVINDKHKIYGRYKMDRGSQPTSTSFVDPLFSALSIQPEYEGQFNDSYVFSPTKTNVLVLAANWYSAYFGPPNVAASLAELPINFYFTDYGLDGSGVNAQPGLPSEGVPFFLTQGRNVTQYQIEDDFSWIHGKNSWKFGANFRRDLVSDYDVQVETVFPYAFLFSLGDFAGGNLTTGAWNGLDQYGQAFTSSPTAHLALYNIGIYGEDEWQVSPKLKFTLGARIDRTGNPLCHNGCFGRYNGAFPASGVTASTPYNAQITSQSWNAFPSAEPLEFQPRAGFNYSIDSKTEIRGGFGLFSDLYPAGFIDNVAENFPNYNALTVLNGAVATTGSGSAGSFAVAGNNAIVNGYKSGQGFTQINNSLAAQGIPFVPPAINATFPKEFRVPMYMEYSFQLQRQIGNTNAVILTYAGNNGYNGVLQNQYMNATQSNDLATASTPLDPRFERVTAWTNNGISNYNGGMLTYKHTGNGIQGEISYTWSHSLDDVSNGGTGEPYSFFDAGVGSQLTPSLSTNNLNYSNSDYDVRHNIVGDVVYNEPFKASNAIENEFLAGWVLGAKTYWRTGTPYSITNGGLLGNYLNLGSSLMPDLAPGVTLHSLKNTSTSAAHGCASTGSCLDLNQFVAFDKQTNFGNIRRNALFGPHFADTDVSLMKNIITKERLTFQLGADAYNVFNKVNFNPPVSDISSGAFGTITSAAAPPTSPYGSFQGAAITQRLMVLHGNITF